MNRKLTKEAFVSKANAIFNSRYTYENCMYDNMHDKVAITCPTHGDFLMKPTNHISSKQGCPNCKFDAKRLPLQEFLLRANTIHENQYSYVKTTYLRSMSKVIITCSKHGDFSQTPNCHLAGRGCPKCGRIKRCGAYPSLLKTDPSFQLYLYIIYCSNEYEQFYKIGLALDIKRRLWNTPYETQIVSFQKGPISKLYPLEQKLHKSLMSKNLQYIPTKPFNGYTECFKCLTY